MPIDIDPVTGAPIITPSGVPKLTEEQKAKLQSASVVELVHPSNFTVVDSLNEKEILLHDMNKIAEEFNGISNIPMNHEYYDLVKRYRILSSESNR